MAAPKINQEILQTIKQLHADGWRQDEIASVLRIHRNSVYRYQKLLGLRAWQGISEKTEKKIRKLLTGPAWGASRIARFLDVSEHQVLLVKRKIKFQRRPGDPYYRWRPTINQFVKIMDYALASPRKHSIAEIARICGTPYKPTVKLCHKICQCERFLTTPTLDSYLPMKHRENKIGTPETLRDTEKTLTIVDYINRKCFDGQLPASASQLAEVTAEFCVYVFQRERPDISLDAAEWEKVKAYMLPHFREAADALRLAGTGLVH
jgi:hypothetical protein